jgi:hypothetical protein
MSIYCAIILHTKYVKPGIYSEFQNNQITYFFLDLPNIS